MFSINSKFQTDTELEGLARSLGIKLNGIYLRDELKDYNLSDGNYILNLDSMKGSGTHWTAFIIKGEIIVYMDSYGMPAPENQLVLFNKAGYRVYTNHIQVQDYKSTLCGYYCLLFLYYMNYEKNLFLKRIEKFVNVFQTDDKKKLRENDKILVKLLNKVKK